MSLNARIKHDFGGFSVDLSFKTGPGVTALFGRSGAGKSTVLSAIAGLETPSEGRVSLGERVLFDSGRKINLAASKRRVGVIFQDARLFPHKTVRQNIRFGARYAINPIAKEEDLVDLLGLGALLKRRPADLSGGEKQRVAIARTLMAAPEVLLADEPLAALDAPRKAEILEYFERLKSTFDIPILYVSHSPDEIARLADEVIAIENGQIIAQGAPDVILGSPSLLPIGAAGAGAVLMAQVAQHHEDGVTELRAGMERFYLPRLDRPIGTELRLRAAAQDVMISLWRPEAISALNVLEGRVVRLTSSPEGGVFVEVDTGAGNVISRITQRSAMQLNLSIGTSCYAVVKSMSIAV